MNIKKILIGAAGAALMLGSAMPAFAKVERVPGSWDLTAPNPIVFMCGGGEYDHTLNNVAVDLETGDFSGTGTYDPDNSYTWNINGNISGDDITFTLVYTGTGAGYTLHGVGVIAPDGSISGTVDNNCQTFSMPAGTATRFTGNHGQWVMSQEDKQEAAQSRIGMPVQSQGHTD